MGVGSHYIYNNALQLTIMAIKDLHESYDAEYLGKILEDMCDEWKTSNIVAIISDNAANITKAIREKFTQSGHLTCMAHTLNLIVTRWRKQII